MIKLLAAVLMLIDHTGAIMFPDIIGFRIIGRLSMPLFAYSIARGYFYSAQNGKIMKYVRNLIIFSIVSQIPYSYFRPGVFNIGFTWLLAAFLIKVITSEKNTIRLIFLVIMVGVASFVLPIEYGLAGVFYPLMFYLILGKKEKIEYLLIGVSVLFAVSALTNRGNLIQVFTLLDAPLIVFLLKYDRIIRIHKRFFYIFYPLHIAILLFIKYSISAFIS